MGGAIGAAVHTGDPTADGHAATRASKTHVTCTCMQRWAEPQRVTAERPPGVRYVEVAEVAEVAEMAEMAEVAAGRKTPWRP